MLIAFGSKQLTGLYTASNIQQQQLIHMSVWFGSIFRTSLLLAISIMLLNPTFCENLEKGLNEESLMRKQPDQKILTDLTSNHQQTIRQARILMPSLYRFEANGQLQTSNNSPTPEIIVKDSKDLQFHEVRSVFPRMKVMPPTYSLPPADIQSLTPMVRVQPLTPPVQAQPFVNMNSLDFGSYGMNGIIREQSMQARSWLDLVDQDLLTESSLAKEEHDYYQSKYKIDSYMELPFCVVVPTYNNVANDRYLRNIRSILMQNYVNYHIVVFDDGSTDGTGEMIAKFMSEQMVLRPERYQIIQNGESMKAMHNLRRAVKQFCRPDQIFMIVDGDDELLGRQVLKLFNSQFQEKGAWFIYSNFVTDSSGRVGYSRPFTERAMEKNNYRNYPFVTSHLRAFYTQLFRNIKESDLRDQKGEYFKAANDVAICLPILEQSHRRVMYIPELTYYYNSNTGQNNHIVRSMEQRTNQRKIRRRPSYDPLPALLFDRS